MSKVFEIKPGYAVELANGSLMIAFVSADMASIEITGFKSTDVKVSADAKPMTFLYGEDDDGEPVFWPIADYNDNLEYTGMYGITRDSDLDVVKVYGYTTPKFTLGVGDDAMKIRPVLWQRDTASKSDTGKAPTYEDAKKAAKAYVGFLDMMTDLVHMIDDDKDDN